jgi:hypothetical protein
MQRNPSPRAVGSAVLILVMVWTSQSFGFDHSHKQLDALLKESVKDGLVDYAGLIRNRSSLSDYLAQTAAVSEKEFSQWNQSQQLALLINVYNAATLDLILQHYPIASIKKIGSFWKGPWDQPVVRLFGTTLTLNQLEHEILRKKYSEPRIHFAIVCAALGCPPLRSEAFTVDRLNEQLADQGRVFLNSKQKNRVDVERRVVYLSPIFKWFAEDFEKPSGSVIKFVAPYFPADAQAELKKGGFKIRYTDYDWSINDVSRK